MTNGSRVMGTYLLPDSCAVTGNCRLLADAVLTTLLLASLLLTAHHTQAKPVMTQSMWYPVQGGQLHVRLQQPVDATATPQQTAIVLLPGPNEHFHADTGWFSLLQPVLARQWPTYAVDRRGSGLSTDSTTPSYQQFATDLQQVLPQLPASRVLLVSFASSSMTARWLAETPALQSRLAGVLLIDPDVATPAAAQIYRGHPASWYQANLAKLLPVLASGQWNERTGQKLQLELALVKTLFTPATAGLMDWSYWHLMADRRRSIAGQLQRARGIATYPADVARYNQTPWQQSRVAVSIIDSQFEQAALQQAQTAAERDLIRQWQQEGSDWSQQLTTNSGGIYVKLSSEQHLLMFSEPAAICRLIGQLLRVPPPFCGGTACSGASEQALPAQSASPQD